MDEQIEMRYYLTQLKNGFLHKNRAKMLDSFHEFALLNKELVMDTLAQVSPDENEVFWNFIESVCDHVNEWREFICSEFERLLFIASNMKDPNPVINSLEAFHILKDNVDEKFASTIKNIIKSYLNTGNPVLKRFLVWFFAYCLSDFSKADIQIIKNLRFDEDLIVRYYAFISYNKYMDNPHDKGLSEIDKLLIDISDIYVCEPSA